MLSRSQPFFTQFASRLATILNTSDVDQVYEAIEISRKGSHDLGLAANLVSYCFKLVHLIRSAWETILVKGLVGKGERELAEARLLLYVCARNVLGSAMKMLFLIPLERMLITFGISAR